MATQRTILRHGSAKEAADLLDHIGADPTLTQVLAALTNALERIAELQLEISDVRQAARRDVQALQASVDELPIPSHD